MGKVNIVRIADNVPVNVTAKYLDVFVGEKGTDLRFKGIIDGEQNSCVYVSLDAGLRELVAIGAIAEQAAEDAAEAVETGAIPDTGYAIPLKKKQLVILRSKPGGAKHASLSITLPGGAAAGSARASASGSARSSAPATQEPDGQPAANGNANANGADERMRSSLYLKATSFVLTHVRPLYEQHGVPMDADVASRCVQTIYIQAMENR